MVLLILGCTFSIGDTDTGSFDSLPDAGTGELCDQVYDTGAPIGPSCRSGELACGEAVEASTGGGESAFVSEDYGHFYCFPDLGGNGYPGPERVYQVHLESSASATAAVSAPCGDMGVAVMRWTDDETCPDADSALNDCEGDEGSDSLSAHFGGYEEGNDWLIVVDSAGGDPTPFRLSLDCD